MHINEIRDYLERAPKRFSFNGCCIVNNCDRRIKWLDEIARGDVNAKINRRSDTVPKYCFYRSASYASYARHQRKIAKKRVINAHGLGLGLHTQLTTKGVLP